MDFSKLFLCAASVALLFAAQAAALAGDMNQAGPPGNTAFREMDRNRDGKVVREEFERYFKGRFAAMRGDKAEVTVESYEEYFVALFRTLDATGTGSLDRMKLGLPDRLDGNGDGLVTSGEWLGFFTERVKIVDRDGDGKIGEEEYEIHSRLYFNSLDINGDGVIVLDEWIGNVSPAPGCCGSPK